LANLKSIRKRITSVKSTQKITRAMKMVAGARLNRAQQRITAMRPYAISTTEVLREVVKSAESGEGAGLDFQHPLLERRPEKTRLLLVITSDRGLCGAFNTNICKRAEAVWRESEAQGISIKFCIIGRKGRDYFRRRGAPIHHIFESVWERLDLEQARGVARTVLAPFVQAEVDSITLVYNEFKSAMTQRVVEEPLFPLGAAAAAANGDAQAGELSAEFIFEPDQGALLERLVPMYVEISILRALYESMASELGARMTAMDAATKNAKEMIGNLTLQYNRVRQAAITTEILEIIGGAEALNA
jgi:F-type H+-transporting ATPase subunit gamma